MSNCLKAISTPLPPLTMPDITGAFVQACWENSSTATLFYYTLLAGVLVYDLFAAVLLLCCSQK